MTVYYCPSCGAASLVAGCPTGCSTRLQSLLECISEGKTVSQRNRILAALERFGPMSRNDLERHFAEPGNGPRVRLSAVCGRVAELDALGLVETCGTVFDPETRRNVEVLRVPAEVEAVQRRLL